VDPFPATLVGTDHPVYKQGSKVKITLEKSTKLSLVFARYCNFANASSSSTSSFHVQISPEDLEFSHCSILEPTDTVESSALMKEDRIIVRRDRITERKAHVEGIKEQRESDRRYFEQLRGLLPELQPKWCKCDVVFHCKSKNKDKQGYQQKLLTTYVKGNSSILSKRCAWLKDKIEIVKWEREQQVRLNHVPRHHHENPQEEEDVVANHIHHNVRHGDHQGNMLERRIVEAENSDAEDHGNENRCRAVPIVHDGGRSDDERILQPDDMDSDMNDDYNNNVQRAHVRQRGQMPVPQGGNALVLDDDDEDDQEPPHRHRRVHNIQDSADDASEVDQESNAIPIGGSYDHSPSLVPYIGGNFPDTLRVTLMHPPEAVKLLLEYCYTNRVVSLGQEAFYKSYKPVDANTMDPFLVTHCGPVSPYQASNDVRGLRSSWPNEGEPTVSFQVAIAGIQLAEEAKIPRLSLMCEIAASQLVTADTALEALALCEEHFKSTGNCLKFLRKTVMLQHLLTHRSAGYLDFTSVPNFRQTLSEHRNLIVPSIMSGINETIKSILGEKDNPEDELNIARKLSTKHVHKGLDESDIIRRANERMKRRSERWRKRLRYTEDVNPYNLNDDKALEVAKLNKFLHDSIAVGAHYGMNPLRPHKVSRTSKHRRRKSRN
jgi:hypothetical protein